MLEGPSPQVIRVLRQHVLTDALLGVSSVPIDSPPTLAPPPSAPEHLPPPPTPKPPNSDPKPGNTGGSGPDSASPSALFPNDRPTPGSSAASVGPSPSPAAESAFPSLPLVPSMPADQRRRLLDELDRQHVQACTRCDLCHSRTQTVFGEGDPGARLMFVGEGPGETEDQTGRPFVGRAGELLDKQILAMGLTRPAVYIANIVKCRPPNNRTPTPVEAQTCWPYLLRQIQVIRPAVIVTLGAPATKTLLGTTAGITSIRGQWHAFDGLLPEGPSIPVMPTFHPAYLLRQYTPENRKKVWSDLQQVMTRLAQ